MYSHSKKWVSDKQKARDKIKTVNKTRNRMFPKSCAWTTDYDLEEHRKDMSHMRILRDFTQVMNEVHDRTLRRKLNLPQQEPIASAMRVESITLAELFDSNHSAVLGQLTVFVHSYFRTARPIAPWPCKEELFHEGDHRISNERHLRRMLPAPRMSMNDTVAWFMLPYLPPLPLDDFRMNRSGIEVTVEFTEHEAEQILGLDLVKKINPVDCL